MIFGKDAETAPWERTVSLTLGAANISSGWITDRVTGADAVTLRGQRRGNTSRRWGWRRFLDTPPKARATEEMRRHTVCHSREKLLRITGRTERGKRQPAGGEEILAICVSGKKLTSRVHREFLQLNNKNEQPSSKTSRERGHSPAKAHKQPEGACEGAGQHQSSGKCH